MAARALGRIPFAPVRGWGAVPRPVIALLLAAAVAQAAWQVAAPRPIARMEALPSPPPRPLLATLVPGEPRTVAALAVLWLQFHDTQPGYSVPFRELDYGRVRDWLERILALAPDSEYPLLLAAHIYGQVNDPERQRVMLDFIRDAFVERPLQRWRWLAQATIIAQHRLGAPELALEYARLLNAHTAPGQIPFWARDLQILVLEDLGELEAARILVGGLLASGEIDDPHELRFLENRLKMLENRASGSE